MLNFQGRIYPSRNPAGTYSFNGSVPIELLYTAINGSRISDDLAKQIQRNGRGNYRHLTTCATFPTLDDAIAAAEALGYVRGDDPEHKGMSKASAE